MSMSNRKLLENMTGHRDVIRRQQDELQSLRDENARLTQERDEARAALTRARDFCARPAGVCLPREDS